MVRYRPSQKTSRSMADLRRRLDDLREKRFARQKETGLFSADTQMAERNAEAFLDVGAWDDLDDDTKAVFARYMEVYAASIESVDENLGRLLDVVEDLGELENTIGDLHVDNGGTAEGGEHGTRSYFKQFIHGLRLPQIGTVTLRGTSI